MTVEITVERGVVNEWKRQETIVRVGGVEVVRLWLPVEWTDGQVVASALFGRQVASGGVGPANPTKETPVSEQPGNDVTVNADSATVNTSPENGGGDHKQEAPAAGQDAEGGTSDE